MKILEVIRLAAVDAGLVSRYQTPNAQLEQEALQRIQWLVLLERVKALGPWAFDTADIVWPAGISSQVLNALTPPIVADNLAQLLRHDATARTPVTVVGLAQLQRLPVSESTPVQAAFQRLKDTSILHLWPTPQVDTTFTMLFKRRLDTPNSVYSTLDLPQEWAGWVQAALAAEFALGQPQARREPLQQRAAAILDTLESYDLDTGSVWVQLAPQGN